MDAQPAAESAGDASGLHAGEPARPEEGEWRHAVRKTQSPTVLLYPLESVVSRQMFCLSDIFRCFVPVDPVSLTSSSHHCGGHTCRNNSAIDLIAPMVTSSLATYVLSSDNLQLTDDWKKNALLFFPLVSCCMFLKHSEVSLCEIDVDAVDAEDNSNSSSAVYRTTADSPTHKLCTSSPTYIR